MQATGPNNTLFKNIAFWGACETAQEKYAKELGGVEISVSRNAFGLGGVQVCKIALSTFTRGAHVSRCCCVNSTRVPHILENGLLKTHCGVDFFALVNGQ